MPRSNGTTTGRFYGNSIVDPLNMRDIFATVPEPTPEQIAERQSALSVIDPYHPANSRPHNDGRNNTYTFRQRSMKLNLTLGWELEANHTPTKVPAGVNNIGDGSVNGHGAEFVVLPSVTKSPRYVLGLLKDLVHTPKLNTDESCGFHVHVSASNLSSAARMRQWAVATEHLASLVEDLAFKAVPDSRRGNSFCRRIVPITSGTTFAAHKYNNDRRYHWLNIVEMFRPGGIRTIENRLLGHTHRWKYVLAWSLFTMELAKRGWDLSNKPFDVTAHVEELSRILINIEKEIKPLSKKLDPMPQWVYNGLSEFGIEPNAWERPLARLAEQESDLRGLVRIPYSDEQPEEYTPNEDECECGCGEEGSCQSQLHNNESCDRNSCEYCHGDSNCDGSPSCEACRDNRHEDGEDCGRRSCSTCHPAARVTRPVTANGLTAGVMSTSNNVSIHPSNVTDARSGVNPITAESMRRAVEMMRTTPLDYAPLQYAAYSVISDATLFGTGFAPIVWDEAAHMPITEMPIDGLEMERRANMVMDNQEVALSVNREIDQTATRNMMTALERDASMERLETGSTSYWCGQMCERRHEQTNLCGACNNVWAEHNGHRCPSGLRGYFTVRGGR